MASRHSNDHKLHATCLQFSTDRHVPCALDSRLSHFKYCLVLSWSKYSPLGSNNKIQVNNNISRIL